jgi:hypothetical protein
MQLAIALHRLPERAAFHHSTAQERTAAELDPDGKAAAEAADRVSLPPAGPFRSVGHVGFGADADARHGPGRRALAHRTLVDFAKAMQARQWNGHIRRPVRPHTDERRTG